MGEGQRLAVRLRQRHRRVGFEIGLVRQPDLQQKPGAKRARRRPAILIAQVFGQPAGLYGGGQPVVRLTQLQAVPADPQQRREAGGGVGGDLGYLPRDGQRSGRLASAAETARLC